MIILRSLFTTAAATTALMQRPQRHLPNGRELRISGSDNYALLFLFLQIIDDIILLIATTMGVVCC